MHDSSLAGRREPKHAAAWLWGAIGFALFFYHAQFIQSVKWNAIELIIAQNLLEHGTYATSLDYPSALTWRPVLPTLVVTFFRLFTSDPILIYRLVSGAALGTLAATMFLSAQRLWSRPAAHVAALLTLICPAITTYLIGHFHSYSHLVALLFLGPALYAGVDAVQRSAAGEKLSVRRLAASGLLWGCCYFCRSELLLFAALQIFLLSLLVWRNRPSWKPVAACLLTFLSLVLPYNFYAEHVSQRESLSLRKTIYGFYTSQGWADPAPDAGPDTEGEGYVYAKKLYGDPIANRESVLRAVANNPSAFFRRIKLNAGSFYRLYWDGNFFHPLWSLAVLAVVVVTAIRRLSFAQRVGVFFPLGLFLASNFILLFHIDPRYLSINIPPLILLVSGLVHGGLEWTKARPLARGAVALLLLGFIVYTARPQWHLLGEHPSPTPSMTALSSFGRHFQTVVPSPRLVKNREPHIVLTLPENSPIYPEDPILLAYFTHSAWLAHGADGPFPRGKLYSFRECGDDYLYLPAAKATEPSLLQGGKIIARYENPVLGPYVLVQVSP